MKNGREKAILDGLPSDEQLGYILRESRSMYDELIAELMQMPNLKFEQGGGGRTNTSTIMRDALNILRNVTASPQYVGNSRFSGPGPVDAIHVLLAKGAGCDEFVTFDMDFEVMMSHDMPDDLKFRVLKW